MRSLLGAAISADIRQSKAFVGFDGKWLIVLQVPIGVVSVVGEFLRRGLDE